MLLGAGIDPATLVFVQSDLIAEHASLTWVLECVCTFGEARTDDPVQGEVQAGNESVRLSLLTYPVLMAADILLYGADEVPVGEDQSQHVELARTLARRFNGTVRRGVRRARSWRCRDAAARVRDLADPARKMAKSTPDAAGVVFVLDPPDLVRRKICRAVTDNLGQVAYDPESAARRGEPAGDPGRLHGHAPGEGRDRHQRLRHPEGRGGRRRHRRTRTGPPADHGPAERPDRTRPDQVSGRRPGPRTSPAPAGRGHASNRPRLTHPATLTANRPTGQPHPPTNRPARPSQLHRPNPPGPIHPARPTRPNPTRPNPPGRTHPAGATIGGSRHRRHPPAPPTQTPAPRVQPASAGLTARSRQHPTNQRQPARPGQTAAGPASRPSELPDRSAAAARPG